MESGAFNDRHLICTVIAPNYVSQALTLGESIAEIMPTVDFRILILQDCENVDLITRGIEKYAQPGARENHKVESIADIDWRDFDVATAANHYTLLEFATSVKPALLRNYLRQGWGRVTYLDPDTQVFSDFAELLDDASALSLTPHILRDLPDDGKKPSRTVILNCGIFNLGFVSVRSEAIDFLDWWSAKLQAYCTIDVEHGYFVDQRWMDWSVNLSQPQVIRDPGMNVSYWNLHERKVVESGTGFAVTTVEQEHRLFFYHFSGYDIDSPENLSKYCDREFPEGTLPVSILQQYAARRKSWLEFESSSKWSIAGRSLGESLPEKWRQAMLSRARHESGNLLSLVDAVTATTEVALPPMTLAPCARCGSCQQSFLQGAIGKLASWFQIHNSKDEIKQLANLGYAREAIDYFAHSTDVARSGISGIKVVGFFAAPTGLGQCARNFLRILDSASIPAFAESIPTLNDSPDLLHEFHSRVQPKVDSLPAAIAFVNADNWRYQVTYANRVNQRIQEVAAVWAWELESVPEYFLRSMAETDQLFALSPYSAEALSRALNREVTYLPTFGELPSRHYPKDGSEMFRDYAMKHGISEPFLLARFDANSVVKRKNPDALLDVWDEIQSDYPSLQFVIKSVDLHHFASPTLIERIRKSPRVLLIDEVIPHELNQELLHRACAYLSLHRAEGLGLNVLEAITEDVPAIFTNYSGIVSELQGMGYPVEYALEKVGDGAGPYQKDAMWASPSLQEAVRQTRRALDSRFSGQWEVDSIHRQKWIRDFYQRSNDLSAKIASDLLKSSKENAYLPTQSRTLQALKKLTRFVFLRSVGIWKLLPLNWRTAMRPHAIGLYRRFF